MTVQIHAGTVLLPNTLWTTMQVEDEVVLYDEDRQQTLHLNTTAALVWRLLDGDRSCGDIQALLTEAYDDALPIGDQVLQVCEQMILDDIALVVD